jgi:hypothetical protein
VPNENSESTESTAREILRGLHKREPEPLVGPKTEVRVRQTQVSYRTPGTYGIAVVEVGFATSTPRIKAYVVRYSPKYEESPMALFVDEIQQYVDDALARRQRYLRNTT